MSVPTRQELIDQIRGDMDAEGVSEVWILRSLEYALAVVIGGLLWCYYSSVDALIRQYHPRYCTGVILDLWMAIYGLTRTPAAYAKGGVFLTGDSGSVLPAGSLLTTSSGVSYVTDTTAIIGGAGTTEVEVTAVEAGPTGNLAAAASLIVVSPTAGIDSAALVDLFGLAGGQLGDTDESARERLLARMRSPAEIGTAADYERWTYAADATIGRVWVYELGRDGSTAGTVEVIPAVAGSAPVPGAGVLAAVVAYLDARRPASITQVVSAPVAQAVTMTLAIDPARDTATSRAAIVAELADLMQTGTAPGVAVANLDIRAAISRAGYSYQIHTLAGGSPTADVTPTTSYHLLTLGTVTWEAWT